MKHGNIRRSEVVAALGLKEVRNNIHTGLLFMWGGQQYIVIFPSANMSAGRPVALGRVETSEIRQFERTPTSETYNALLEDDGKAIERAIGRIDSSGILMQLIWDVLYCVGLFGYRFDQWEKTGMSLEDEVTAAETIKLIKGETTSQEEDICSGMKVSSNEE